MRNLFGRIKTPTNSEPLCRTCTSGLVFTGYGKSERRIMCTFVHPNVAMPFTVSTCSGYHDRNRPRKPLEGFKVDAGLDKPTKVTTRINVDLND